MRLDLPSERKFTTFQRGINPRLCDSRVYLLLLIPLLLTSTFETAIAQVAECPPPELTPGLCPCYNFEDGLFLECAGATEDTLKSTLQGVMNTAGERQTCFFFFFFFFFKHNGVVLARVPRERESEVQTFTTKWL